MKSFVAAIVSLIVLGQSLFAAPERERIALDGQWAFTYTRSSANEIPVPPPATAFESTIQLPGWWDDQLERFRGASWFADAEFLKAQGPIHYLAGIGWHRKDFLAPREWEGRTVTLTVGRAITVVNVWLNGRHLGRYDYGVYTPFELDLTRHLKLGERNEILIAVDNTKGFAGGWAHLGNVGRASGITQPVTLEIAAGGGRISDLFIEPGQDLKEVRWNVELEANRVEGSRLEWEIWDTDGQHRLAQGATNLPAFSEKTAWTWQARANEIKPWSDREPNLYVTRLRWVTSDGAVLDTHEQRFGLRRYTLRGRELLLNGIPIYLRGSFGHYYFPEHTTPPTEKKYWLEVLQKVKSLGFNFVNFAAQVAPVEMLEAADELGIILQCGDHHTVLAEHTEHYEEVWKPIVRWTRRHPSMAIYGFGGERNYYEGIIEQYQKQHDLIKRLYSEALVMPQQAIRGIDYSFDPQGRTELTRTPFPHHAERLERYTRAADLFGHYSSRSFSYTYDEPPHWREMDDRFRLYAKPIVHHELFMGASYLSPENARHYTGRTPPYLYEDLAQRLKEAGLSDKWPIYFRNSALLQQICLKYNIEKVRKSHELAGFELLALYDMHFVPHYTVGLLDEFMRFKADMNERDVLRYNGESVLLIDYDDDASLNRAFYEGTRFEADAFFSFWGSEDFGGGTFEWILTHHDKALARGAFPVGPNETGRVLKLARIALEWPKVDATTKMNLRFRLTGGTKEITNDWDFWVFPQSPAPELKAAVDAGLEPVLSQRYTGLRSGAGLAGHRLAVVSRIGAAELEHLNGGGDVVLLGTEPLLTHTGYDYFRPGLGARGHHNVGSVLTDHPIFKSLPHEGWGDWHFYSILNGAAPFLIDEEKMGGFDPIIEIISSAADIRKQAVIFERRVGAGRLLVSSSVINLDNPASVALLDGIFSYVGSPAFKPALSMNADVLFQNIAEPDVAGSDNLLADLENWKPYGDGFEYDRSTFHRGVGSIRFGITTEELTAHPGQYVGAVAPTITMTETPETMRISAWYKTDGVSGEAGRDLLFVADLKMADGSSRKVRLPLQTWTSDWQNVQTTWKQEGEIRSIRFHAGMANKTGTVWIDQVYLGRADGGRSLAEFREDEVWTNQPVTLKFDQDVLHRIENGPWERAPSATISREGITRVATRDGTGAEEVKTIRIDAAAPVLELAAQPPLDQAGGDYTARRGTYFQFIGRDRRSGVARIEYQVNSGEYRLYTGPFTLPKGRHTLAARVTDRAGNINTVISGEMVTGGETTALIVTVE
ncbi:MAG: hypothetical protein H0X66_04065 [Verrucomicrobia bacterium]|nr:hypothetical protein [Verrucomicrobiota bacterium]